MGQGVIIQSTFQGFCNYVWMCIASIQEVNALRPMVHEIDVSEFWPKYTMPSHCTREVK